MLIHKQTMGVLSWFWTGRNRTEGDGHAVPVMAEYTFENTGLPEEEWWSVPAKSPLGKRLLRLYPDCIPVVGEDGTLIGATVPKEAAEPPLPEPTRKKKNGQRRRKRGLLSDWLE